MTSTAIQREALPEGIQATLRRLIWRTRAAIVLRGVLATLAAAHIGILAAMGIRTQWIVVEPWQAYALTLGWLAAGAAMAYFMLVRPLARSFTLTGIARLIESRHPELQERISSTVELLSSTDAPEIRGSASLIRALAAEAGRDVRTVRPRKEITFRKARPFLYAFTAAAVVIVGLLVAFGADAGRLLAKTVVPTLNLPNFYAGDLKVSPGNWVRPAGTRVEVSAEVTSGHSRGKLRSSQFRLARADGPDKIFEMSVQPDGTFRYTTPPLHESIRYRVRAADAVSEYYTITVVPRPAVAGIEIGYDYPDYTQLTDLPRGPAGGDISAPVGTVVAVSILFNKPLAAVVTINGRKVQLTAEDSLRRSFTHKLDAGSSGTWTVTMADEHGFEGTPLQHKIIATTDTQPEARIHSPAQTRLKLSPRERVEVFYSLADDFGLASAELLAAVDGRALDGVALPAVNTDRASPPAPAVLDLAKLDLAGARCVTFQIRARDNRPDEFGGAQEGLSAVRTIELDVKAPSYVYQVQLALDLRVRETLQRIHAQLLAAKKLSEPLRRSMPATETLTDKTVEKIDRLRTHLLAAERDTRSLAEATAGSTYPELSSALTKLADRHIGKARELAGLVKITDAQKLRSDLTGDADWQVDRAIAVVSDLLKQFDVLTEAVRRALKLMELAQRQEELAAAELATTQPADDMQSFSLRQWEEAERDVARETGQLSRQEPAAMREQLERGQERSTDLAQQARRLQRSQEALAADTTTAERIRASTDQLRRLAAEQADLAKQVTRLGSQARAVEPTTQPVRQAAEQARRAAGALATTQPTSALPAQSAAAKALDQTAERAQAELRKLAAREAADLAERMARQQQALAEQSQAAKLAQQAAEAAQKPLQQARAREKQIAEQIASRLQDLAQRQSALAEAERKLQKIAKIAEGDRVSETMDKVAQALRAGKPRVASKHAVPALHQAQRQASMLWRRASGAQDEQEATRINRLMDQAKELSRGQARLNWEIEKAIKREAAALAQADKASQDTAAARAAAEKAEAALARRLEPNLKAQKELAEQAGQLQQMARKATPQAQRAAARYNPAGNMSRAATALQRNRPTQASPSQQAAAEQLRQLARAARPDDVPAHPGRAEEVQRAARDLAARQRQLQRRTMNLTQQLARDESRLAQQELRRLRAAQQQIKREAAELSDDVREHAPQPDRIDTRAARAAGEAAKELDRSRLAQAAQSGRRAAEAMSEMGRRLARGAQGQSGQAQSPDGEAQARPDQVRPATPSDAQEPDQVAAEQAQTPRQRRAQLARRSAELARRQQRVAQEVSDLNSRRPSRLLASRQQRIAEQTEQVRRGAELIDEHIADIFPDSTAQRLARQARTALEQAAQAQASARRAMAAEQPGQSVPSQRTSSSALGRAHQALAQLGGVFAREARRTPPTDSETARQQADQLADAYEAALAAARSAGQTQAALDAERAAQLLAQLAQQAVSEARGMGLMASAGRAQGMSQPNTLGGGSGVGLTAADLSPGELKELGIAIEDWARLPGELRDQVLQAARQEGPEEYRSLIRRYFKTIAKKGANAYDRPRENE